MTGNPSGERRCPDDLVVRGQREHLNELEHQALAAHLSQCRECRASLALTALFDAVPDAQPGDDDLIARVADRAMRKPRRPVRWAGLRVAAVVALVILTGGAATAALLAYRRSSEQAPAPEPPRPAVHPESRTRVLPQVMSQPDEAPAIEAAGPSAAVAETQRKHRPSAPVAPVPAVTPTVGEAPTAAALFSQANAVRRRGDVRQAIALYQDLRQRFPASSQAMLSAISVGDLLLGQGDAAAAVMAYTAYLQGAPKGSLTEEALYGRARGLRMLGQSLEERQTWEELVRRFPRSAYQPTASRRLRELAP